MKKMKRIGMSVIAPIMAAGMIFAPAANAFMMTDFAPGNDVESRSVVQMGSLTCTGVLIAPQYVLTASHCVASKPYGEVDKTPESVYIGPDVSNREKIAVEKAVTHPIYDVALLKLKEESKTIPAKIYAQDQPLDLKSQVSSYGWGTLASMKSNADLIDKEDLDSLYKNIASNKVRKVEGTVVNGRLNIDENGQPIKNDKGQIVISRYTSAKGFDKMKGENAGVNIKFTDPSKSVYGDSGAPIFSNGSLYGILSGGLLQTENVNEGSTIVSSPIHKILPWLNESTGIDFNSPEYNKKIDEQVASANLTFKNITISDEDIAREKELISKYKENLIQVDKQEQNDGGDTEVDTPIDQREKLEDSDISDVNANPSENGESENNSSNNSGERYTITDEEGRIIDYGYGDPEDSSNQESNNESIPTTSSTPSNSNSENPSDNKRTSDNENAPTTTSTPENTPIVDSPTNNDVRAALINIPGQQPSQTENTSETQYNDTAIGPKVDTGGKVHTSIIARIINFFK